MRFLRGLLVVLIALAVIVIVVGFLLPERASVERSIEISAPPPTVYGLVVDFREFNRWSPWYKLDPEAEHVFEGPESGVGAKMSWRSDKPEVGSGSQEILEAVPHSWVKTLLDFGEQGTAFATFKIEPQNDATIVTWGLESEFGYDILGRYFGLWFERLIGPVYEDGLRNLKSLAEAQDS